MKVEMTACLISEEPLCITKAHELLEHPSIIAWEVNSYIKPSTGARIYRVWLSNTAAQGFGATAGTLPEAVALAVLSMLEEQEGS